MSGEISDSNGWERYREAIRQADRLIEQAAPDANTKAEGLAYIGRLFAAAMMPAFCPGHSVERGVFWPYTAFAGGNPDYKVAMTAIEADRRYRLDVTMNDAARVAVGAYTAKPRSKLALDSYRSSQEIEPDDHGRFTLQIGLDCDAAQGLRLTPTSNLVMIRELQLLTGGEPARIALTSLDDRQQSPDRSPISGEKFEQKIDQVVDQALGQLEQFFEWSAAMAAHPNTITPLPERLDRAVRGDPDTLYYSGYYDLVPGEALVIDWPAVDCFYRTIQVMNHWLEPIPGSHWNHATATPDKDGRFRFVVSDTKPGFGNWLPTGGRGKGTLLYRTLGTATQIVPEAWKTRL